MQVLARDETFNEGCENLVHLMRSMGSYLIALNSDDNIQKFKEIVLEYRHIGLKETAV